LRFGLESQAVLGSSDLMAFVATTDAARARRFYEQTVGLPLVDETPFACVFNAHGTMLRVTLVERVVPAPHTVLGWSVADIRAAIRGLADRDVKLLRYDGMEQDELGVWRALSGALVAWFEDPDGNRLSLT
jgi:catechol 2,3-dioxygenase-like lactoylglutathione lyase family enzyme